MHSLCFTDMFHGTTKPLFRSVRSPWEKKDPQLQTDREATTLLFVSCLSFFLKLLYTPYMFPGLSIWVRFALVVGSSALGVKPAHWVPYPFALVRE